MENPSNPQSARGVANAGGYALIRLFIKKRVKPLPDAQRGKGGDISAVPAGHLGLNGCYLTWLNVSCKNDC